MIDGLLVTNWVRLSSPGHTADQDAGIAGLVARLRELVLHVVGPAALAVIDDGGADRHALAMVARAIEEAGLKDPEFAREVTRLCDELARRHSQGPRRPDRSHACPVCGEKNRPEEHFCGSCGAYLAWAPASTPGAAVEPAEDAPPHAPSASQQEPLPRSRPARRQAKITTDGPSPSPLSRHAQATIDNALSTYLRRGRLLFNPPEHMRQGRAERVKVAIAQHGGLDAQLRALAKGSEDTPITDVETTPFMAVELKGSAFSIASLQLGDAAEQLLRPTALWQFDVTAERSGSHPLQLFVAMRIPLPDRPDERVSLPVLERTVHVRVDAAYSGRRFVQAHWQWLAATLAGLGGAIAAWIKLFQG